MQTRKQEVNAIISIKSQNGTNVVDARELHSFLEIQTQFKDWIVRRIEDYHFLENEDYQVLLKNELNPKGGRPTKDYAISIDMAKELCMVERNVKGRIARKYFIEVEKNYYSQTAILEKTPINAVDNMLFNFKIKIVAGSAVSVITEDEEWYKINDLFFVLGYKNKNSTNLVERIPHHCVKRMNSRTRGNITEWYINREGLVSFMFNSQKHIPISAIAAIQKELFEKPEKPEIKEINMAEFDDIIMKLIQVEPAELRMDLTAKFLLLKSIGGTQYGN